MSKRIMGIGAAMALALAAGTASAQCTNYFVTAGTLQMDANVAFAGGQCDDCITPIALPFTVNLYGQSYTSVNVSSNGNVQLVSADAEYDNECNAAFFGGPTIMPHWDDLWLVLSGYGIHTGVSGAPGSQKFVIEWRGEYFAPEVPISFQMWLHEGSSQIDFVYGSLPENGQNATVGISDGAGNNQVFSCDTANGTPSGTSLSLSCTPPNEPQVFGGEITSVVGSAVLLTVQGNPGNNPPSTSLTVTGDLSSVGLSASQQFYDNGTNGDTAAGDGVFSYLAQLPHAPALAAGTYTLAMTITDNLARTGNGNLRLILTAEATGGCCTGPTCSVTTAYNCGLAGGSYNGNGTSCSIATSANAYSTIAGTGTILTVVSDCDDCTEPLALPFTFNFYGVDYTSVNVSTNGNIHFGAPSVAYFNDAIPTVDGPNNAIYPFWDDLNPLTQGDILYRVDGVSPNQTLTIEWNNVTQYTAIGAYPLTSENFQVVLFEGSNNIEFRYGTITAARTDDIDNGTGLGPTGDDYTVGLENADGSAAVFTSGTGLGTGNLSLLLNSNTSVASCGPLCGTSDFNGDGDFGTDQDIEAFFACLGGQCCATCFVGGSDFNGDGDFGTDQDIESFFRVLGGGNC
jgi:hypothetical protein